MAKQLPANCTGTLTATGPGPTQTVPIPPLEVQFSLGAGEWTLTAKLVCGSESSTGQTTVMVVPPTPVNVSIQVQGHGNLNVTGAANGTVTSSPPGIACGRDCSETYTIGVKVTLTATPNPGFVFGGYRGGACGNAPTCQLTITTSPISIAALFNLVAPTPPPAPTTGTLVVMNIASRSCCEIPTVTFSGPGSIAPVSDLAPGKSETRSSVPAGSYTAAWCGGPTPFTVPAGATFTLALDGLDCG